MNHENCFPAELIEAHAVWYKTTFGGLLVIHAKGKVNNSCMQLDIEESPLAIWPPQFFLCQYDPKTEQACSQVITEREVCAYFHLDTVPEYITLIASNRTVQVDVVVNGACDCPIPMSEAVELVSKNPRQRTGISHVSRQQAFDNALRQFGGPQVPPPPGIVTTKVVEELGVLEFGRKVYIVTLLQLEK